MSNNIDKNTTSDKYLLDERGDIKNTVKQKITDDVVNQIDQKQYFNNIEEFSQHVMKISMLEKELSDRGAFIEELNFLLEANKINTKNLFEENVYHKQTVLDLEANLDNKTNILLKTETKVINMEIEIKDLTERVHFKEKSLNNLRKSIDALYLRIKDLEIAKDGLNIKNESYHNKHQSINGLLYQCKEELNTSKLIFNNIN